MAPNGLYDTFGPQVVHQSLAPEAGLPPSKGFQFFGEVAIDPATETMTINLRDRAGSVLHRTELEPEPRR